MTTRRAFLASAVGATLAVTVAAPTWALGRAWLGAELTPGPAGGVVIRRVMRGSPAERAGLRDGDHVLTADGAPLDRPRDLIGAIQKRGAGAVLGLRVRRGGREFDVQVGLVEHPGDEEVLRLDKVGAFAPAWKGVSIARGAAPADLAKLRGKVVLVDFWASWCVACRISVPVLNELSARYGAQGLVVVGLTDDSAEVALRAADRFGIAYSVGATTAQDTLIDYGVRALPTLFLVDKRGVIRHASIGVPAGGALQAPIERLLGQPP